MNDLLQGENSKLKSQPVGLPPDALAAFPGAQDEVPHGTGVGIRRLQEALPA